MNDRTVKQAFLDREETAPELARQAYGAYCSAIVGRILADPLDVEEVVNDALLAAWNSVPPNDPPSFRIYLGKTARNLALARLRRDRRIKRGGEAELVLSELDGVVSGLGDPEEELLSRELTETVNEFLRSLKEEDMRLFVRRYYGFEDAATLASELGISSHALTARLSRLRKKLKQYLNERGYSL